MKTQPASRASLRLISRESLALFGAVAAFAFAPVAHADIPDGSTGTLSGMYKIASSSDPIFPMEAGQEWFLDFGKGISAEKLSGSVAVSLRQNPNVKVRIMAWQYFPQQDKLVIGNTYSEGSRNAVARGIWTMSGAPRGVLFERDTFRVVLHRADPADY
ncbi:MAG: hypothetical protein EOP85_16595 [Verrucomicrobiaceae bacterium]|nr:MAG: hypothetical protein EOP85_16595 [Verrucomicrobiaceae bacterium]